MIEKYIDIIKNPPEGAKGYTRWWWYGCAVTKEGIKRQLQEIKDAGMGGVEIQILYPISRDDKSDGIINIPYFSPEFFDIIDFTANACNELDLMLDFTLGSSWPYGGPFVPEEFAMQYVVPYQIDLHGPSDFKCDLTTRIVGDVCSAVIGKMENSVMQEDTITDITDKYTIKELFSWPWGTEIQTIKIPEGEWKLFFFVVQKYSQVVRRPSLNTEGYVIDHCSDEALDCFVYNMAQPIVDRIGKGKINSFFCDSLECDGHNWSGKLLDEFKKRRGYDLQQYIYALWGDIGEHTGCIRYDYFLTMSELTVENFFQRLTKWGNKNESKVRIQAHGTWGDILKCYASCDIPEGETFGEHDKLECNTIHRRLAVSAGHIYGKNIISNETFTWLKTPRFVATLEDMKAAVDAVFVDGINMIVNHGFPYTTENVKDRGWPFYASTHIGETNSWWKFYHNLADYIQKVSAILREGRHYSNIAIYLPQADVWSDNVLSDIHMAMKLEEHIGRENADRINKAGYWFDYINDEVIIELSKIDKEGLKINNNAYKVVILIGCTRLPVETARRLDEFVRKGGILISTLSRPSKGCGFMNIDNKTAEIEKIMSGLFPNNSWNNIDKGRTIISDDKEEDLINHLKEAIKPDLSINCKDEIGYVHRVDGDNHIYFTANISRTPKKVKLKFNKVYGGFKIVNAETDKEKYAVSYIIDEDLIVELDYEALESLVIIFSPELEINNTVLAKQTKRVRELLIEDWTLTVPEMNFETKMDIAISWERYDKLKFFSGEGIYESKFIYDRDVIDYSNVFLEVDNIYCAAKIFVNDKYCGDMWKVPHKLDIESALLNGTNNIKIIVVNTLINEAINPSKKDKFEPVVIDEWPYFGNVINNMRKSMLYNSNEKEQIKTPQASGISGKVKVVFHKE